MQNTVKVVDGFKFLPPKLSAWIRSFIPSERYSGTIPFHPLSKPLSEARLSLVTSAGIHLKSDPPFDMQREKQEPTWGDPTYRVIPRGTRASDVEVNHLHINTSYITRDLNVMLPLDCIQAMVDDGKVGDLAPTSYSFYGFQWERTQFLDQAIQPMIEQMQDEAVDVVLLTPA
jgi:D-proline reductase (dithiol) PrdB